MDTPAHVDEHGLHQNVLGKVLKLLGHGGREQQRLPLLLEVVHDLLNLFAKKKRREKTNKKNNDEAMSIL